MNAEIIAVGSELLTDSRTDTNSLFLTGQLNSAGVEVVQKCVIGDDLPRLTAAVRDALQRSEIVILSGGLGPTEDDLTRDAVAAALGRTLVYHEEIATQLAARFARLNRKMSEVNKRQAFLVSGAIKLENPNGTAPGQWIDTDGRIVMMLPGPPGELKPMFERMCLPKLAERLPVQVIHTLVFRVAGMPESDLDQLISPVYKPYMNPATTILAAAGDIQVHLRARADTAEKAKALAEEVGEKIAALLGDRLYSRNGDPMEAVVGAMLREHGATLATAESCTGGMLAARITDVPGSSQYFLGGWVTYSPTEKTAQLGVDPRLIEEHTAVSEAVAMAMAAGARERSGATYALSVTGEAGPESATPGVEPGTVWIGFAGPDGVSATLSRFIGTRARVRGFAVQASLNLLRRALR